MSELIAKVGRLTQERDTLARQVMELRAERAAVRERARGVRDRLPCQVAELEEERDRLAHRVEELEQREGELVDQVSMVYDHVTGGRISKANTDASAVISEADARLMDLIDEAVHERIKENPDE